MNIKKIREDFPILNQKFNNNELVYFDNAATTQKPQQVIDAVSDYYQKYNANVHRGLNFLSQKATDKYEEAHEKTAKFINAEGIKEIVFTKNASESLNLAAYSLGEKISSGDEILISVMEHHSNIVPWQMLAKRKKAKLNFVNITSDGRLDLDDFEKKLNKKTKIVALTKASNILGTINPLEKISKTVKDNGSYFVVDAAQSVPHTKTNVKKIDADLFAFSAHKMLGPTGIGVLYGKEEILKEMNPFLTGGDMISKVSLKEATWNKLPWKFEAGTPNIAGAIGFGEAIDYINKIGIENIEEHEKALLEFGLKKLKEIDKINLYGPEKEPRTGIISFNLKNVHPHDVAQILDENAIAIRSGNHCAQPLMEKLKVDGVARISFYLYNTKEEIEKFVNAIDQTKKVFGV
ncbi:MAG: cysteine desulfurase [Candidatus Diapherotrites archaeon]|uniref:cysteine desulfurase n=1 Tax=Candidatus Iainarchaeum sp. TaxID=3101447 RepID=A0A2D6LQ31_9ARCH|nr:cysteine desulfurase [Candidatus Diapherotrites archaeon]